MTPKNPAPGILHDGEGGDLSLGLVLFVRRGMKGSDGFCGSQQLLLAAKEFQVFCCHMM